jgi:hypothetical protein
MSSEWMKVMLDEIARKKSEADEALAELERRRREQETGPSVGTEASHAAESGNTPRGKMLGGRPAE